MRLLLLFACTLVMSACDACDTDPLVAVCSGYCIVLDGEILESGADACAGVLSCDADGTQHCDGYRPSTIETCNGVDDDCDGAVDEGTDFASSEEGNPCRGRTGACGKAPALCVQGELQCAPVAGAEVCDGEDNDCDGAVDEDLGILGFEYHGPPETLNVGDCRAGVIECVDGSPVARGEVGPTEVETCGDDHDTDCDGALNPDGGAVPHDVVLVLDYSGSMAGVIQEVVEAVCEWGAADAVEHNFAAIEVARDSQVLEPAVLFDFVPPDTACTLLLDSLVSWGGGVEYMLDGITLAHRAGLNFSGAPQDIVAFTDEAVQYSPTGAFARDVLDDCDANGYRLTVFTLPDLHAEWIQMASGCGGSVEDLGYAGGMRDSLLDLFGTFCS